MRSLPKGVKILDPGAGRARLARSIFAPGKYDLQLPLPRSVPEFTAVAVVQPDETKADPILSVAEQAGKFRYLQGTLGKPGFEFECQLGFATYDGIPDVFAALHCGNFDRILYGYGPMLKPGGFLFAHFELEELSFRNEHGRPMPFKEVFDLIAGLTLQPTLVNPKSGTTGTWMMNNYIAYSVQRTEGPLRVPQFEREMTLGFPPKQIYKLLKDAWINEEPTS